MIAHKSTCSNITVITVIMVATVDLSSWWWSWWVVPVARVYYLSWWWSCQWYKPVGSNNMNQLEGYVDTSYKERLIPVASDDMNQLEVRIWTSWKGRLSWFSLRLRNPSRDSSSLQASTGSSCITCFIMFTIIIVKMTCSQRMSEGFTSIPSSSFGTISDLMAITMLWVMVFSGDGHLIPKCW